MSIDWWTLGLQTINALVLIWILSRFLFRPVSAIIAERRQAARDELDRAAEAMKEAKQVKQAAEAERADFAAERASLIDAARAEAEAHKALLMDQAAQDAARVKDETSAGLERMREHARQEVGEDASRLALQIARKLVTRLPQEVQVTAFVTGLCESLAALPTATRDRIAADGVARIKAPRALTPEETNAIEGQVSEALGRAVTIDVTIVPALVAGLELDADTATVRNHLGADLDRITEELLAHV